MPSSPPAGTSPASAYDIQGIAEAEPPPAILADAIDPYTGEYTSLISGLGLADAFVIEAIRVQRGTGAAVRDTGNRYREMDTVDEGAAELADSLTREALAPAVEAGVLAIVDVAAEPDASDGSQLNVTIEYRDLLAPRAQPVRRLVFSR
jgi:hypothetical protein